MNYNEAIEVLNNFDMQVSAKANGAYQSAIGGMACKIAVKALSEIQKYRAIGTVEEFREARERQRAKKPLKGEPYTWIDSVRVKGRYRDVRKTSYAHVCPNCRKNVAMDMSYCKYCGQAIDWNDTP